MPDTIVSYEAIIAAFCLVSYADGELHASELSRFVHLIKSEHEFAHFQEDKLLIDIKTQIAALDKDFEKAKAAALGKIKIVKNDFKIMGTVIKVARIAMIADDKILESEEAILAEIHRALGLTETY